MRPGTRTTSWLGLRWGAAISALLHLGIAAAVLLVLPTPTKPKATPPKIPVEIVRPLEKPPEKKKPEKKLAKKKPDAAPKAKPKPVPKEPKKEAEAKLPEKLKPAKKQTPLPAEKAKPKMAAPKKAEPKIAEPAKEPPRRPVEQKAKPPEPKKVEKQLAEKPAKAKPKGGGRKVKPNPYIDNQISMIQRKLVGRWILQPLKVNLQHRCGKASISGFINLTKKRGNRFFGTLRTTLRWAHCPPEGMLRRIVLVIRGNRVVLRDSGGGVSRGLIQGNLMSLRDSYGQSVWVRSQ